MFFINKAPISLYNTSLTQDRNVKVTDQQEVLNMRRLVIIGIAAAIAACIPALAARDKHMSVQVREAQVRSAPGFLSKILATVPYTEQVSVLEEKADWVHVQTENGAIDGWMHNTALTSKRLKLSGSGPDAQLAVSSEEQALAGKGFNSDVEKQFKERNKSADFADVDKMEKLNIPPETIKRFLVEGEVKTAQGGAR